MLQKFWSWYDSHLTLNTSLATVLFVLQLIHLYWLTTHIVFLRLFGESFFNPLPFWELTIILVDYTEIPALISVSLIYINNLHKKFNWKSILFLIFLNSQWLHIFWITDEFVIESFTGTGAGTVLPIWLVWVAILIDYLELPIIFDTLGKTFILLKKKVN